MPTVALNHILKEVDAVHGRLEVLSYAGAFNDIKEGDYADFVAELKKTRKNIFERQIFLLIGIP
ncbi:MAG: hypothetical protein LBN37_07415 [Bacteroidales bacterium]|jgi:hypothetical protein|nr:hypothetical protein [Bacteroidales bacterium]